MSITAESDKLIVQSSNSFNLLLSSIPQRRQSLPSISDVDNIDQLGVAEGLKELLLTCGLTLELLQNMSSNDLAETLGIDKYVARIIINSAINSKKPLE